VQRHDDDVVVVAGEFLDGLSVFGLHTALEFAALLGNLFHLSAHRCHISILLGDPLVQLGRVGLLVQHRLQLRRVK
jgi:hypothetical protein